MTRIIICLAVCVSAATIARGGTIREVFDTLNVQSHSARVQLGGTGGSTAVGPGSVQRRLVSGESEGRAFASETLAYAFATDNGASPGAESSADGGGFFVLGDELGVALDFDGSVVVRLDTLASVVAGDKAEGPGSISGFATSSFKSNDLTGGLSLRTSAVSADVLSVMGVLAGLSGGSEVSEDSVAQQNFTGGGRVVPINGGVGFVGLRADAQAAESVSPQGDQMPGPAVASGGIRVSGFESLADPPLVGDIFAYFRSGSRYRLTGPDWLTDVTELPDNPFPELVPEPSSGLILLMLSIGTCLSERSHFIRKRQSR